MQIVFFCPPATAINGGIKYIFRMAETLLGLGIDAAILEEQARRPTWFPNSAPVLGQSALTPNNDQIYVLPEDQVHMLEPLKDWPQKKIIYSQNHFYSAYRLPDLRSYADFGVSHIFCSSRTIYDYARIRHPSVSAHIIPYSIDRALFKPASKQKQIAFMPRKRPIEAAYIRDLFRTLYPQHRAWQWRELTNLSESDIALAMSEAEIFLSLSRLEGFGLTPLEAMAADCIVAGFTGIGGREYATKENGFWAQEDDFDACISALAAAVKLNDGSQTAREAYRDACQATISAYTPAVFHSAVETVWREILKAA